MLCFFKSIALVVSEIFKKNHFVTAAKAAADIDDSISENASAFRLKKSKMSPPTASGRIYGERCDRESRNSSNLSRTTSLTYLLYMTSLTASGRLQKAIK